MLVFAKTGKFRMPQIVLSVNSRHSTVPKAQGKSIFWSGRNLWQKNVKVLSEGSFAFVHVHPYSLTRINHRFGAAHQTFLRSWRTMMNYPMSSRSLFH
jgi:hypothetical protein